jgi:hypothetical protein
MKMVAFWDIASCSLVKADRRLRDAYYLHHHSPASNSETSVYFNETTRRYIPESCHFLVKSWLDTGILCLNICCINT